MINNIQSQNTFTGKPQALKKILPATKNAFFKTFQDLQSPSKALFLSKDEFEMKKKEITDINNRLGFVRKFIDTLFADGGLVEYFRGTIGCVKAFKVANCSEYAEITKTILKMNGVKKCDMFELFAQKGNSNEPPRSLNHAITAINIPKSKNNKRIQKPFIPSKNTIIADMWLDGYIGKVKNSKNVYKKIGLMDDEIILFKPMPTFEPNEECFASIRKEFPTLIINKQKKTR